ncbi:MAG: mandelate racemase/muconate lactonizing enzyme family protein [Gammaproteobacteria bacterium]|nr:mandelate racemase/muconate lactonizing enzyme family protein [Gammaproteobacteria bacterium]
MIIEKIETFITEMVGFVRITTGTGDFGWGQVPTYNADITSLILHRQVAPHALGNDVSNALALITHITEFEHKFPGSYLRRALAGLDTAIWDLQSRPRELPVCALIGGTPGPVRAYASSMKRDIKPEQEASRMLELADTKGFDAFKIRVGSECGHDRDEWPDRTETMIKVMSRAFGSQSALLADTNSCYSPERAINIGKMLEDGQFCHFEEPCPYWEFEQTRKVREALDIDVTGGEQECELPRWRHMIDEHVVDIVQPDICYAGGLDRTLEVAKMAAGKGLPCTPHSANLSMVTLFTMHLLRAIPNAGNYLELSIEGEDYYPWQQDLFTENPYQVGDGHVTVANAPGWGMDINPEWLNQAAYCISSA